AAALLPAREEGAPRVVTLRRLDVAIAVRHLEGLAGVEGDLHVDGPLLGRGSDDLDARRGGDHDVLGLLAAEPHLSLRLAGLKAAAHDLDFVPARRGSLVGLDGLDLQRAATLR